MYAHISFIPSTHIPIVVVRMTPVAKVNGGPGPTATLKQRRGGLQAAEAKELLMVQKSQSTTWDGAKTP